MITVSYDALANAVATTGMIARGGFVVASDDDVPDVSQGTPTRCVVVVGNAGGGMWPIFRAEEPTTADPLDTWTRRRLQSIADRFDARLVHPSDEPFLPFQRWARRAGDVWPSPISLLVHGQYGLWHAYRGAFLFAAVIEGLPPVGTGTSPCVGCASQPCLSACPVGAFDDEAYDAARCRRHVHSGDDPACAELGCAARLACPVGVEFRYGADQMKFHMRAFAGSSAMVRADAGSERP